MNDIANKKNPLSLGIKKVGIGKKGSLGLTEELTQEIIAEISSKQNPKEHIQIAALLGALLIKKPLTSIEKSFICQIIALWQKKECGSLQQLKKISENKLKKVLLFLFAQKYIAHLPKNIYKIASLLLNGKALRRGKT